MTRDQCVLAGTAVVAMLWVIARACTQAITIDEATTYLLFVQNPDPFHWLGSSNNHVLNTTLMRLTTRIFGVSEVSARLPALLGATIYIAACYRLCQRMGGGIVFSWALLVCLIYNPFIMDHLVAARGYSLALGFLMAALVADHRRLSSCAVASACVGLAFTANFSFAIVCGTLMAAKFLWSWSEREHSLVKLLTAYAAPAIVVTLLIPLPSLVDFPTQELFYGSHSLAEMFNGFYISLIYELNQNVLGPKLYYLFLFDIQPWLYPALGITFVAWAAYALRSRVAGGGRMRFAAVAGGAAVAALLIHWTAFHTIGLLLPKERTGIFFVPLTFVAMAAIVTLPSDGRMSRWLRGAFTVALLGIAINNIACMRLNYFREWNWNQESRLVHQVLTCLHEKEKVQAVASGWPFVSVLNFYRQTMPRDTYATVPDTSNNPEHVEVYVLEPMINPDLIEPKHLKVAWHGSATKATIALPPEQVERLGSSACWEISR
ncbi:MAG: hypothetical protein ABI995_15705 [Acidobacteriota bacterium]